MLRFIEDESTTEQREEQEAAAQQLSFHHQHHHSHHQDQVVEQQQQQQSYWANQMGGLANFAPPPTPNPYRDSGSGCGTGGGNNGGGTGFTSGETNLIGSFDAPLKDFNSAFRQTPAPLSSVGVSAAGQTDVSSDDDDRGGGGINWSSVLSLSSQAELDPLNNNTYTDSHHHGLWTGSMIGGGVGGGSDITDVDLSHHSFDDISWKLSPISADEVLKAFPEENLFQCAA
jgi:hypothetical protein